MRFDLRLTNPHRQRWLLWGWLAYLPVILLLIAAHLVQLILVYLLALLLPLLFYNKLLRQPAWVQIDPDCITWANPADGPVVGYQFADLRAYRFEWGKSDIKLTLYPWQGQRTSISGRLHKEFLVMQHGFERAVKRYNQLHLAAAVVQEPSSLTKFFTSPRATQGLWGLLALGVVWVGWGASHDAPGQAYLPLLLLGLPYLILWANFYYERP